MATLSETVEIIFRGVDQTTGSINSISSGLGKLESSVGAVTGPLNSLANTVLAVDAAFIAVGTAILVNGVQSAIKAEAVFADLSKVLSDSEKGEIPAYKERIRELSLTFGELGPDVTDIVTTFKEAGFSIDESLGLAEEALTAVRIGGLETGEAAELLKASIRGFGLEAKDAATILDATNAITNNYGANLAELQSGLAVVSGTANAANLTFQETSAILTPVIEVFGSGDVAARALNTGLLRLVDDNPAIVKALNDAGVAQTDANGALRSGRDILFDLIANWGNVDESQRLATAGTIFGKDQAAKFNIVLNEQDRVLGALDVAMNSSGSRLDELAVRLATTETAVARANVVFATLSTAIGDQLLDGTGDAANAVGNLGASFLNIVETGGLAPLFDALRPLFDEFSQNINKIAENLPKAFEGVDFANLIGGFDNIGGSLRAIFDGIDLTTPEGLTVALQGIIDAGAGLANITAGIIQGLEPLFDLFVELTDSGSDLSGETQELVGQFLGWGKTINTLLPAVGALSTALAGLAGGFGLLLGGKGIVAAASGIGSLAANTGLATAATAALATPVGAVAAGVAALGVGAGVAVNEIIKLKESTEFYNNAAAETQREIDALNAITTDYTKVLDSEVQAARDASKSQDELTTSILTSGKEWTIYEGKVISVINPVTSLREEFERNEAVLAALGDDVRITAGTYDEMGNVIPLATEKVKASAIAFAETGKSAKDAAKESESYLIAMEQIASNERIELIEATFALNAAEVQAEAQIIEAAFEGIAATVESTGSVLGDLFSAFASADFVAQEFLKDQIEREQERRDEALLLQAELTESQIRNLNEKTEALRRGEALIRVEANNLSAPLELIWLEILREIQVKANAEGVEFLLDLPNAA